MARSKGRSRKRKFHGNRYQQKGDSSAEPASKSSRCEDSAAEGQSASARKIPTSDPPTTKRSGASAKPKLTGYRFMSVDILGELFGEVSCKECGESELFLEEEPLHRKGCASFLRLVCGHCGWKFCFHTSKKGNKYFEVNRRSVWKK